jgi:hypothetical protein
MTRTARWLLILALLVLGALPATAQEYFFSVPRMVLSVTVAPDASVALEYEIIFQCNEGAHPIDAVDIGMPHSGYDISNMTAAIDGEPLTSIEPSPYVKPGVAVNLNEKAIAPGQRGKFTFRCTMPNMVWQDTTRKDYASLRITPTWFDSQYVSGTTELYIVVYVPKDIKPEELLYQDERVPFSQKLVTDKYTAAVWYMSGVRVDGEHLVGISFPKRNMTRVMHMTPFGLFMKWWKESPDVRLVWGIVLIVLFTVMFFRASAGTGCSCFVPLAIGLIVLFSASPLAQLLAFPGLVVLFFLSERALRRRRGHYLPPIASVEGGGIKRGLTAPEAAVLLEQPLSRVLTLVLFGLLKKGIIEQVSAKPLEVKLAPAFDFGKRAPRRQAAQQAGTVIHDYEQDFLDVIHAADTAEVARMDFKSAMKGLIEGTAERLKGFDVDRSRSYYNLIVAKAWADARGLGDVEKRTEYTDDNLLWLLMSPNYDDEFTTWHTYGYRYDPPWTRSGGYVGGGGGLPTPAPSDAGAGHTTFSDVAASFSGWTENVSSQIAGAVDGVKVEGAPQAGIINLAGVDKVTGDMLANASSGSGGGGHGGGCACACAGCACACACAGGGR